MARPIWIDQMVKAMQPEAFYAVGEDGQRAVLVVFDMADLSQLPVISEPLISSGGEGHGVSVHEP